MCIPPSLSPQNLNYCIWKTDLWVNIVHKIWVLRLCHMPSCMEFGGSVELQSCKGCSSLFYRQGDVLCAGTNSHAGNGPASLQQKWEGKPWSLALLSSSYDVPGRNPGMQLTKSHYRALFRILDSRRLNSIVCATLETNSLVLLFREPWSARWLSFIDNLSSDYCIIRLMLYLLFLLGKHSWKTKVLKPWKIAIRHVQLLYFIKILKCRNIVNTFCIVNMYLADGL